MFNQQIKEICQKGKVGLIPGWKGYIRWDYDLEELYFINGDYRISERELEDKIINRTDLYYII